MYLSACSDDSSADFPVPNITITNIVAKTMKQLANKPKQIDFKYYTFFFYKNQ